MPLSSPLPERLRYPQSFSSRPDELNEETAEGPLLTIFIKRISGHSAADAQKILEGDLYILEEWLALPGNENDCLQFVRGFLTVSPGSLATRILEESAKAADPLSLVEIDLPHDATMKRISNRKETALILRWKGLIVSFQVIPSTWVTWIKENSQREGDKSTVDSCQVRFGEIHGTKFVRRTDLAILLGTHQKEVNYLLEMPEGFVSIEACPLGKKINHENWDELAVENLFRTLRIVKKSGKK